MSKSATDARMAVETGYWPLYRYQPDGRKFNLDGKKLKGDLEAFLARENRFAVLSRKDKDVADALHHQLDDAIHLRHERLRRLAEDSKRPAAGGDGGGGNGDGADGKA